MFRKRLACSFCSRSAAEVEKLVAGPRVYICDRCAATAVRIMSETHASGAQPGEAREDRPFRTLLNRVRGWWSSGWVMASGSVVASAGLLRRHADVR
jgi:hypothetical protein